MDGLYRFSPINSEEKFDQVLKYLIIELEKLSLKLLHQKLPVNTLKVFAHYQEEYDYLYKLISGMGPKAPFNSDTSYYVQVDKTIKGHEVKYIGIRVVDPYRLHVGCGDFKVKNFDKFTKEHSDNSQFVRSFRKDMIEIWHPDFDVLGYIIGDT